MDKIAAKREKNKLIVTNQFSSEPTYKGIFESTKIDLIRGLNHYSKSQGTKESYNYLHNYIKNNNKELLGKLNLMKPDVITNKGFIIRMIENGFTFSPSNEKVIDNITSFIRDYKVIEKESEVEDIKIEKQKPNTNVSLINYIDEMIDSTIEIKFDCDSDYKVIKKHLDLILEDIKQVIIDPETGEVEQHYLPKTINRVNSIYQELEKSIQATKKTIIRKQVIKKVDPYKVVKNLKYLVKNESYNSIKPIDILGKKKLFLFDTKYRKLRMLISNDLGFTIKGTTIENVNMEKSFEITIKEKDVPALYSNKNVSSISNFFKNITKKQKTLANSRVNEFNLIMIAS
jgi:hypothetical protein